MSKKSAAPETDSVKPLRIIPVQHRSHVRIEQIVAAALIVLAQIGRDRFTTADVAREAKVSIGTIYRYFADGVAILDYVWPDRRDTFPEVDE